MYHLVALIWWWCGVRCDSDVRWVINYHISDRMNRQGQGGVVYESDAWWATDYNHQGGSASGVLLGMNLMRGG